MRYIFPDSSEDTAKMVSLRVEVSLLLQRCLLEENTSSTYSMHSLVQQSVVETLLRNGTLSSQLRSLSKCLSNILPKSEDIQRNLSNSRMLELASNVYSIAFHILIAEEQDDECWNLLHAACSMAKHYHHLTYAVQLAERRLHVVHSQFVKGTLK